MTWKPHVTVAAIAHDQGKFLMVREKINNQLVYNQPAGHLEAGESLIQAVVRETLEETAWHFRPESLTGVYRWQVPASDRTYLRFCFSGVVYQHDQHRSLDSDIEQAVWLSLEQLLSMADTMRSPLVLQCLQDYQAGIRLPLSVLTEMD